MAFAVAIFAVALALIASERVDRTKVALLGATLVLLTQTIDQEQAIEAIDFNTIGLLVGMMIMVRLTETTGVYTWLAIRAGQLSRGRPLAVVLALGITTAVLSAFLDNVTTILLIVPITFLLADALDVDPIPLVIIEIVASNIGGTATLIGDPPNILIAGHTGLSFGAFIANLAPIVVVTLVVVITGLYLVFRWRLQITPEARERVMALDASKSIEDPAEARRTVPILVAHDPRVLLSQGAASRAGDRRARRGERDAARDPPVRCRTRSPASSGRRCSSSSACSSWSARSRRPAPSRRSPRASPRSPAATAPPSCSASSGCRRSARGSWTTSRSPPR